LLLIYVIYVVRYIVEFMFRFRLFSSGLLHYWSVVW